MLDVLRPGVLEDLTLCVVGDGATERERAAALGARVVTVDGDLADEDAVAVAVGALGHIDVLVVDAASAFADAGGGMAGLRRAVDDGWNVVRAVVNASWVSEGDGGAASGGKVVFLAPATDAGEHANAVGAALENAARTLSVEWARFGVRITAVRPREGASDDERAELVAFLASPAGTTSRGARSTPVLRYNCARNYFSASRLAEVSMQLQGIHHITAITGDAPRNLDFYTRVLGLRLVAKTVNQDDPCVYHLFYADEQGHPGSEMTFFEYPHAIPGRPGAGMVHRIVWRVGSAPRRWTSGRAPRPLEVAVTRERRRRRRALRRPRGPRPRAGRRRQRRRAAGRRASRDPRRPALQGFDGVRAYATDPASSGALLEQILGAEETGETRWTLRGEPAAAGSPTTRAPAERGRQRAGSVHHVAWGTTVAEHPRWQERFEESGLPTSGIIDRTYFKSIYFREPSGVLFEIADDAPGFTIEARPSRSSAARSSCRRSSSPGASARGAPDAAARPARGLGDARVGAGSALEVHACRGAGLAHQITPRFAIEPDGVLQRGDRAWLDAARPQDDARPESF